MARIWGIFPREAPKLIKFEDDTEDLCPGPQLASQCFCSHPSLFSGHPSGISPWPLTCSKVNQTDCLLFSYLLIADSLSVFSNSLKNIRKVFTALIGTSETQHHLQSSFARQILGYRISPDWILIICGWVLHVKLLWSCHLWMPSSSLVDMVPNWGTGYG